MPGLPALKTDTTTNFYSTFNMGENIATNVICYCIGKWRICILDDLLFKQVAFLFTNAYFTMIFFSNVLFLHV